VLDPGDQAQHDDDQQRRAPDDEFELGRVVPVGLVAASVLLARYLPGEQTIRIITGTIINSIRNTER
jgi:hypothetical protein